MNKFYVGLFCVSFLFSQSNYYGSTTAPVTIAGGIIKAKHAQESIQKYKRKDCPVCKGKGWYMSGDGILKIECTYCETETKAPPVVIEKAPNCVNGKCNTKIYSK